MIYNIKLKKRTFMNQQNFLDLIKSVNSTLKLTPQEIKTRYGNLFVTTIETCLEVRLNTYESTLICLFDNVNRCNKIYLFLDNTDTKNKTRYLSYLSSTYMSDPSNTFWKLPDSILQLQDSVCDLKFVVYE